MSSSPGLPSSAPTAEAPSPELSPFAKELAERAKTKKVTTRTRTRSGNVYKYVGERYANLRRRQDQRESPKPASLPPDVAAGDKYQTKELIKLFKGEGERTAPQKWFRGKYVGQTGVLLEGSKSAAKYLTEEERAAYEVRSNKDNNLFYWEKTGKVFDTTKMTSVGGASQAKGRAIFVMTASGKIYAANEGYEFTRGMGLRDPGDRVTGMDPDERWRINHSSFLAGEPVAAAGELIFKDGALVGITDVSGHYFPEVLHMRQVIQEFVAQGIDVSGVWVMLSEKVGKEGDWYVQAQDLIKYPQHKEAQFRAEKIGSKEPR